jgi:hypothetical protein
MAGTDLTADRLRELLHYDTATGQFRRLVDSYNRTATAGSNPCCLCANGYLYISIENKRHLAHRLAWLYGMANGRRSRSTTST